MIKDINKAFNTPVTSRRGFLKAGSALGLSLVVGFNSKGKLAYAATDVQNSSSLNPFVICLLYTSPSPRDQRGSRMPSSA